MTGCSYKLLNNSDENCSPYSEYKVYEIDGKKYRFNVVEGKSNPHIENDYNSFFYKTNFDDSIVKKYLNQLKFKKEDIVQLYNLELFITKTELNEPLLDGKLVSAIVHFIDKENYLYVRYFELESNKIQEVETLRTIVPYISASASYLNFKFLKENDILTNSFIFYNKAKKTFNRINKKSFDELLINYKRKNGTLPKKYKDL